ncbi:MAG TPA: tetratricopeptide repeat protein [Phycisphaerae bacterium]|nr:tetratricopeptide repeat protein [Phycisphaerae bacterium]
MRFGSGIQVLIVIAAAVSTAAGAAAPAAAPAPTDPFYQGLEQRGLRTLMEAYLRQQGDATSTPGTETTPAPTGNKLALARMAVQNATGAKNMAARDTAFQNARKLYEGAIADASKALAAIPADRIEPINKARLELMNLRLEMANMIFQNWIKTDLDLLEVTDRRGGDRARTKDLLKVATDLYTSVTQDTQVWLSALDQLPQEERRKYVNSGQVRKVQGVQREAEYSNAWILYYYGWVLPEDYKPPAKGRTRNEILQAAITAFQPYTDMPERVSAKWYAYMVVGMAYRELGKYEEALQSLAMSNPPPTDANASEAAQKREAWKDSVRIRVACERAITYLKKGDFGKCRETLKQAKETFKEKLDTDLYGLAMPIVEAESYIVEGQKGNQQGLKDQGVAILKEVHKRDNPWPMIVQWVMEELVGEQPATDLAPFQLWIKANDALAEAQEKENPEKMKEAEGLFKAYAEKVGAKDPKYPAALYSRAACLLQVGRKTEAAKLFRQVADEAPTYKYADAAARYAIGVHGEVYENEQTEENRAVYEEDLRWFIAKWIASDPDQQYYYALVLYRGKKYVDAADAFSRVAEKAEHYADSRYWVPLCRLDQFREKILPTRDKQLIITGARNVAKGLLAYADYAFSVQGKDMPEDKQKQLLDWAEAAYINAADVYLYAEVALPADALPILKEMEQKFKLSDEARGRVLKLLIDAYQKLGQLDEARKVLDSFLTIAKPADVGPVLRGLFRAMTDDVRDLIKRQQTQVAAVKVEQAKALGDRYLEWLAKSDVPDKNLQIENSRYDLAELYLAVGNYGGALTIYQEIGGMKPWEVGKDELLKEDCIYGMARAFEGLGEAAADAAEADQRFETALDAWRVLSKAEGADRQDTWERTYHLFYCKYRLGQNKEVHDSLRALEIMKGTLGGKDPVLQKKFRDLKAAVAGAQ